MESMVNPSDSIVPADSTSLLVEFNPSSQLPLKLTGPMNFVIWKAQVESLMFRHDLYCYLDGTLTAPSKMITLNNQEVPNPKHIFWFRQDQLIRNALMASVDSTITLTIAKASTSKQAWDTLHNQYANKSHKSVSSLPSSLTTITKNSRSMTEYQREIRNAADELATAGTPIPDDELSVKILSGFGPEYDSISAAIQVRDTPISDEELYNKLLNRELLLKHKEPNHAPISSSPAKNQTFSMDHYHRSEIFPSIYMDIEIIEYRLILKLNSVVDIAKALNLHSLLPKLDQLIRDLKYNSDFCHELAEILKVALCEAEHVVDKYEVYSLQSQLFSRSKTSKVLNFFSGSNHFVLRIKMVSDIEKLVNKWSKTCRFRNFRCRFRNFRRIGKRKGRFPSSYREKGLTHTRTCVHYSDVVGRDIDRDIVVETLLKSGNETSLFVFPIVGVGGIGKTTLAKLVYNDPRIVSHFQLRLWVRVSREFKVEKLLEQIVNSVREDICENLEMNELQNLVQETLYGNNFLIVLDDVWNEDPVKWDELKKLLIAGDCGGKILVTTWFDEVASMMGTVPAYCLKGLLSEDCLVLFLRKAFEQGQEVQRPNLVRIASDIVQKCEGNPLLLMILGSSLHKETRESEWDDVNDNYMWNSNQNDKILPALRVGYERLPSDLKVCLAYCSIFPKDCVIEIDKLIQLWLAEGLISQSDGSEDLEHIGIQYFQELLSRSFFQEVEEYRSVNTSICTLHDLVHDLALSAAGTEFCTVNSHMQNISDEVRRVAFSDYDLSGKELPASLLNNQALRAISFSIDGVGPMSTMFVENCIARFMQLRVLDISDSCIDELPSSVGKLMYLRYLDLSANGSIKELPDSINKLLSLQTLRVSHCPQLEGLPKDIGDLISLRHLHITTKQACFPDKAIGCLSSLRSLYIHSCNNLVSLSEGLQHLTNLRTLAIIGCPRLTFFPSAMKHLSALENLLIVDCEELTLLEWQDIEGLRMVRSLVIGGLPELESKDVQCLGNLQMLVLAGLPQLVTLPRWLEGASATLQYLRVERCLNFAALPKWLEKLTTLEKLEISKCCKFSSLPEGMSCLTNLKVLKIDN